MEIEAAAAVALAEAAPSALGREYAALSAPMLLPPPGNIVDDHRLADALRERHADAGGA